MNKRMTDSNKIVTELQGKAMKNRCNLVYVVLLLIFILQSFYYPNFILSEEHHYLEVATYMFDHHQWGLLQDSVGKYLNKPPCLFWILSGLWFLFGKHVWVIHFFLLSILAAILYLTQLLYTLLFENSEHAKLAPIIILGCFFFLSRGVVFCFDTLVVLFFLLSMLGIVLALKHYYWRGFILFGFAVGLGILTKGPIILGFCLPFFAVATFFRHHYNVKNNAWFLGFIFSVLIILLLVMSWILPLIPHLVPWQIYHLLLQRGFDVGNTYGAAPIYFYIKALLLLFLPWLLWPYGLQALFHLMKTTEHRSARNIIFYSLWLSFLILSFIPPKEIRYVMSWIVLFALFYTNALWQNKSAFCVKRHSTRSLVMLLTGVAAGIEIITLCFPRWIMSYVFYSDITYLWIVFFESLIVMAGGVLICLPKGRMVFEALRLGGFTWILILSIEILPHEVISSHFSYSSFVNYLNDLKKQNIPIIYCRAYGGYQYSLVDPPLPEIKYTLKFAEKKSYTFVYFVEKVGDLWANDEHHLYRLVSPDQQSAILVKKIPVREVMDLNFRLQHCSEHLIIS